ncbi:3-isopropylmalate dehydratase small subunit [Rhizorhabdus sp.]|jgi:3-isopropylmalate/(R)-2-methylmalate dehydratase small subunit|uniref:3-isopropylmalate dehydratase small subunit n=1 Tax=Rhizorhabdus sp. TaxID=1968843 RepID=UPI001B59C3A3|nr:3-isopropylmalate dehydratase small subunit [Rhizorhabdus sp.]MBP8233240.1 3-isopropylmalate dehydratase small subunit [Rhizorhabdus sp.]
MKPFVSLEAPALHLIEDRIDTDVLFPARFLLIMEKDGLGRYLCYDRRFDAGDHPVPNPIDPALAAGAGIWLAGKDFGCGSSREQAVWALAGAGFSCVVAESFGEIFAANCLRNGLLAINLDRDSIDQLGRAARDGVLCVDLPSQRIGRGELSIAFGIDPSAKERLLNGWDEIDTIMARASTDIDAFETAQRSRQPWLY